MTTKKRGENQGALNCNFCGKSQKEVKKLIAGPGVYMSVLNYVMTLFMRIQLKQCLKQL